MYDYMLEEMADAIAKELHIESHVVFRVLYRYWEDKIAHVWQVDDMLEAARRAGKPITRTDAAGLLQNVFDHHDSSLGISWTTLDVALDDYHFDLKTWPEEKHNEVHGVFKVWQKGNPIAQQLGMYPNKMDGNLPEALTLARKMAKEKPGEVILIGLEDSPNEDTSTWLSVILSRDEIEPIIEDCEEPCTP